MHKFEQVAVGVAVAMANQELGALTEWLKTFPELQGKILSLGGMATAM